MQADPRQITAPPIDNAQADELEGMRGAPYEVGPELLHPLPGEPTTSTGPDPDTPDDQTPPAVVAVQPEAGAANAPVNSPLTVTFDEPIWDPVFSLKDQASTQVAGGTVMSADHKMLTFTPVQTLTASAQYLAEIREVTDEEGNTADPYSWSFTTEKDTTAPQVTTVAPVDGATQVSLKRKVTASFSESVSEVQFAVVDSAGVAVPGSVTAEAGTKMWTFTPSRDLSAESRHTITVSGAKDLSGNVMVPYSWSFTTRQPDTTPPAVTGTSPAKDARDVEVGAPLRVTFNEPVTHAAIVVKDPAGTAITGEQTMGSETELLFTSTQPLAEETAYTAEVTGATDESGNVMAAYSWTFTTAANTPPENAPVVEYEFASPVTDDAGEVTSSLTPEFEGRLTDPDGRASTMTVQVEHDPSIPAQGSGPIWSGTSTATPSGSWASMSIPANKLQDGWKTRWRARATAGGVNGAWTDWHTLTVDVSKPSVEYEYASPVTDDAGEVTSSLTPEFEGRLTDPDGRASTMTVQVEHDPSIPAQGSGPIWSGTSTATPSGSWAYVSLPGGKLQNGWKTRWRARATAGGVNGAWTDWHSLTVTLSVPARAAAQDPSPIDKPFNYERMTLDECTQVRKESGRPYAAFGWAKVRPYTACYSRWKGWGIYKVNAITGLPAEPIKNGVMMETSLVMNTYLGTQDGNHVQGAGVGGSALKPRDISVFTSVKNIKVIKDGQEIPPPDDFKIELDVDTVGSDGSSCDWIIGERRTEPLSKWIADGYDEFLFRSNGDNFVTCTIKPTIWLYHPSWIFENNPKVPLWAKPEIERVPSRRDPLVPTVRCDSLPMGPYMEPYVVIYKGACRFMGADRIFQISRTDEYRKEVAQHIWDAFYDSKNTKPPMRNDFGEIIEKDIPGNYDAPRSRPDGTINPSGKALTKISENTLAADGKKMRGKNRYWTTKACQEYYPNWAQQDKECDEFPFASTQEGAGDGVLLDGKWFRWENASARAVKKAHNRVAGRDLWLFYARYRVVNSSKFWVSVK
ncbi:Ig-like domain-containing protein [Nonomuraea sp. NPDC050680]|uniref:Ig-like domain-containing protein n=1 Tax=Nonomuraea sp. NPDC050680 TaxID=3154630 RepID=UPI0033D921FE